MEDSQKKPAATLAATAKDATKAFFDINQDDTSGEVAGKVAKTGVRRVFYAVLDYWLMALSAAFIIWMDKGFGYGWFGLFMLMWLFDLVVAIGFVMINETTGEDITLAQSYRRAVDVLHQSSRFAGFTAMAGVVVKASVWDGPEHLVIFFKRELRTELNALFVLISLTALQAAVWTPIYILGFDTLADLYGYAKGFVLS